LLIDENFTYLSLFFFKAAYPYLMASKILPIIFTYLKILPPAYRCIRTAANAIQASFCLYVHAFTSAANVMPALYFQLPIALVTTPLGCAGSVSALHFSANAPISLFLAQKKQREVAHKKSSEI
jgi:hypothetical protein